MNGGRLGLVLVACGAWLGAAAYAAGGQTSQGAAGPQAEATRTELSLGSGRSLALVTVDAAGDTGVTRVGALELDGNVRIGALELGRATGESRYDLLVEAMGNGWQLKVLEADSGNSVGAVPLSHGTAPGAAHMAVALLPTTKDGARIVLRWQEREASADVQFLQQLTVRPASNNGRPNEPVKRGHFEEANPRLVRAMHLSQANYAGLALPGGRSLALWYPRLSADGPDFEGLRKAGDGDVVALTQAPPPRLRLDVPITVAGRSVQTGNLAPGFHGSYGLWLKRRQDGWRLVFNGQPDVWGSQHDAEADVFDTALTHSEDGDPSRPFGMAFVVDGPGRGQLRLHWGPHNWSTPLQFEPTR